MAEVCNLNENIGISTNKLKRNNYFKGKRILAKDLVLEQNYFINKIKELNREVLGYGIVSGLEAIVKEDKLLVSAGVGLDSCGNCLALYEDTEFELPKNLKKGDYLGLVLTDIGEEKVPKEGVTNNESSTDNSVCGDECCFNHIVEEMKLEVLSEPFKQEINSVCVGEKKLYTDSNVKSSLCLGRYDEGNKTITPSGRTYLATNAELSQLLCKIKNEYVSSLNGQHGDVKIVGGNNISIKSENREITVSTVDRSFREYPNFTLLKGATRPIDHDQGLFPSVDIYRRIIKENTTYTIYLDAEVASMAHDLNVDLDEYKGQLEVEGMETVINWKDDFIAPIGGVGEVITPIGGVGEVITPINGVDEIIAPINGVGEVITPINGVDEIITPINGEFGTIGTIIGNASMNTRRFTVERKSIRSKAFSSHTKASAIKASSVGGKQVYTLLNDYPNITGLSAEVARLSTENIKDVLDRFVFVPQYSYEKVIGKDSPLQVKVTHVNKNRITIHNLDAKNDITLLIILNT